MMLVPSPYGSSNARMVKILLALGLDVVDGIGCLDVHKDGIACERFGKYLHASAEPRHNVELWLRRGVVVRVNLQVACLQGLGAADCE